VYNLAAAISLKEESFMGTKTLHMIGNAHIDPVWLWQWQEGFHEVKATFRSALERMIEFPDFKFTASSAALYQWVEENDPAMFKEIQQRVAEGRWALAGGWWIEPDCNIPGGESFVRQGLYGQHYFKSRFGKTATVGYNVDSFGHNGMLPQILKKSGLPYYIFMRPDPNEKLLPSRVFWWESPDGSRVLTLRLPAPYGTWAADISAHIDYCAGVIHPPLEEMACFYGVGDHGGGPTIANIECILKLSQRPEGPALLFSTPSEFFAALEPRRDFFPVVHDDLQHHASGCYAVHSGIKSWMRQVEHLLLATEKLSSVAAALVSTPPRESLSRAWTNLLFNQFHDILAGTSLEIAYEDTRSQLGESKSIAGRVLNNAVQALAWNISISQQDGSFPLVVFNPNTWPTRTSVELEIWGLNGDEMVIDSDQHLKPLQFIQSQATTTFRSRFCFMADLPALGYATYRLVPHAEGVALRTPILGVALRTPMLGVEFPAMPASDNAIENDRLRLEIDPQTGCIGSLVDKTQQWQVFSGPAARAVVLDDPSDTWSHGVFKFDQVIGEFKPDRVSLLEHGPVQSTLRVESSFGSSKLIQDFTLFNDLDLVRVSVWVDWQEHQKMLKLRFPVNVSLPQATYEIPYGFMRRPTNGVEYPGQSWVDLTGSSGRSCGLSLINNAKYSYDIQANEIGLTVLRSPIFAHHTPAVPDPARTYTYIDQGVQQFTYILLPHPESWQTAGTVQRALELNQPPFGMQATSHPGSLPTSAAFISVEPQNIIVTVLKQAEDGQGLVLRAVETSGHPTHASINLAYLKRQIEADFGSCEIKTFLLPTDPQAPVIETNLLEW
jgi:alpha-mannosidase